MMHTTKTLVQAGAAALVAAAMLPTTAEGTKIQNWWDSLPKIKDEPCKKTMTLSKFVHWNDYMKMDIS